MLRLVPAFTILVLLGPVIAGLWGTLLPAFGHFPSAGSIGPNLDPIRSLISWPGLWAAARLSLTTGILATAISLGIVILVTAGWSGTRVFHMLERLLSPLLSVPHAAVAFGLAFLIAPSGWVARLFSPWATGWHQPPDLLIVHDPFGLSLTAALIVKEVPFLLLMTLAALGQVKPRQRRKIAQSLGYRPVAGWLKTTLPGVYSQIRLPVYVVLAYSMSVVDVAVILGPTTPTTLSAQIVKWMGNPDIAMRMTAAAAALLQLILVLAALAVWRCAEIITMSLGRRWIEMGGRGSLDRTASGAGLLLGILAAVAVFAGIGSLLLWSFAGFWSFPHVLPDGLTLRSWMRHGPSASETFGATMLVALSATFLSLALVLGCLEAEHRTGRRITQRGLWLLYLPLLIPQTAFLPGLQTLLLSVGADVGYGPVVFAHLVFVLPYVFLSLGDPWRAWDPRNAAIAASLGASPLKVFWIVRLPMLLRPILVASAVGVAVSVGQYLPTLLIGGGRVSTLTTEAVALASGGDRRAIGVYGLMQTIAAFIPFAVALMVPAFLYRNRRGLHV